MRVTVDREVAAELVVVLEAIIHSAGDGAWYVPAATAGQDALQQALRVADVIDAHARLNEMAAA